jgi:hypothetical protein
MNFPFFRVFSLFSTFSPPAPKTSPGPPLRTVFRPQTPPGDPRPGEKYLRTHESCPI